MSSLFAQVDLLLSIALAVDRFVAVSWPLCYKFLMCPQRKQALSHVDPISCAQQCICMYQPKHHQGEFFPSLPSTSRPHTPPVRHIGCADVPTAPWEMLRWCLSALTILGCFCLLCTQ